MKKIKSINIIIGCNKYCLMLKIIGLKHFPIFINSDNNKYCLLSKNYAI